MGGNGDRSMLSVVEITVWRSLRVKSLQYIFEWVVHDIPTLPKAWGEDPGEKGKTYKITLNFRDKITRVLHANASYAVDSAPDKSFHIYWADSALAGIILQEVRANEIKV